MTTASEKLALLRDKMTNTSVDYYYVPTRDDHNNEYVPDHWQRRPWLTGFTGSYGEALIGLKKAYLWTDPRYYLQAELELDAKEFQLMKQLQGVAAPVSAWLGENAFNATVGVDPKVISISQHRQWSSVLSRVHGELTAVSENWVDAIWKNKPALTLNPLCILDKKYTGLTAAEKLSHVRAMMKKIGADALVVSQLDEVAWLYNIRGTDVPYNTLVISYAIVTQEDAFLFVHLNCVPQSTLSYFAEQKISLESYDHFQSALKKLSGAAWVDPATTSWWVELQLDQVILIEQASPIVMMKAIKNNTELKGMREAHRLDAIAIIRFLHWIENHWEMGVDEVSASEQLEKFRRENVRCKDLSFGTICGFGDHGAIVHYHATSESAHKITDKDILLVDSGGQYYEGTTDITRTIHLGTPTVEQKKHYTWVLQGHLALRHIPFPKGACGEHVNAIARMPLWKNYLDFGHGTGHGVGCYLCVHEGPQRIAYGTTGIPLQPGMIVSNEPGLYFTGKYGIRIENLCEIIEKNDFHTMADLTMVPYARKLIDKSLLSSDEIKWIDEYHQTIYDLLEKDLSPDARAWLKKET